METIVFFVLGAWALLSWGTLISIGACLVATGKEAEVDTAFLFMTITAPISLPVLLLCDGNPPWMSRGDEGAASKEAAEETDRDGG